MNLQVILLNITLLTSLILVLFIGFLSKHQNQEAEKFTLPKEEMKNFILWKSFYINPEDPRGKVPKIWGYGWTVNFRNRKNAIIFSILIILCLFSAFGMLIPVFF